MVIPQVAFTTPAGGVPGRVSRSKLCSIRYKSAILDDQGDLSAGDDPITDQFLLSGISDDVTRGLTSVYIQAGDAPG